MKLLRRAGKILLWAVLGLLLLVFLLMVAVQQASVQTWLTGKATDFLSKKLDTHVSIGGVDIDFFKTAVLNDIFVADQQGDTLLYARRLSADIGIFNLFKSEIYLNQAGLTGAVVHLRRPAADSVFNYQFIVDAFASEAPKDTTGTAWAFGIGELALKDVRFTMLDEGEGRFDLNMNIATFDITTDELDFVKQEIALKTIDLKNSEVAFRQLEKPQEVDTTGNELLFPGFGWTVTADRINLEKNHLAYHDDNAARLENALDYSHLDLRESHLFIQDFQYADDGILAKIDRVSFRDGGGFQLDELSGEVQVLPQAIEVKNLVLKTPQSDFKNNSRLVFNAFNDLKDFVNRVKVESDFEESHLAISDLLMLAPAIRDIESLQFQPEGVLRLEGGLVLENNKLTVGDLFFSVDETTQFQASGSIAALTAEPLYNLKIEQLTTSYESLKKYIRNVDLPPGLKKFGQINLSGTVSGTLGDLVANDLKLTTQSATRFSGDLRAKGLPNMDKTVFDLKISDLATRSDDLRGFSENPLPPQLDSLGLVQFAGDFKGTIKDFDLTGKFATSAGGVATDLDVHFNQDYSFAQYSGKLAMENFDLGRLLGDTMQIGEVSLNFNLKGEGLTLDTLNTTIDGVVKKIVFREYEYNNLQVDGRFMERFFEGNLNILDENISFDMVGKINFNDSLPELDVTLRIDTIHFKNLNLSEENIGLSGFMEAKLTGGKLDNLQGLATLTDFALTGDKDHYFDKQIVLEALQHGGGKRALRFDAGFLKARIEGRYNFGDLPRLIVGYLDDFFPTSEMEMMPDSTLAPRRQVAGQQFEFDFQFTGLAPILGVFLPGISEVDTSSYLTGSFDSAEKILEVAGAFPNIKLQGIHLDSLLIGMSGNRQRLESSVKLRNLDLNGTFYAPFLDFKAGMGADTFRLDLALLDDSLHTNFKWGGRATGTPASYTLVFDQEMILNREAWAVDEKNATYFTFQDFLINDLVFSKNNQSIAVKSTGAAPPGDLAPVEVRFNDFDLGEISALLNNPDLRLEGSLDGEVTVMEPKKNLHYKVDARVGALTLNDQLLGDLTAGVTQPAGQQVLEILTTLTGGNEAEISGTYGLQTKEFDVRADLGKLNMVVADPFMKELIRGSEGHLSGRFTLKGTPEKPVLTGNIATHGVSTEVVLSRTRYRTDGGNIVFSENEIDLGQLLLLDEKDRRATLSGKLRHSFFTNIQLDMRAQTDGLQILNTTRKDNPLYYGTLFARADVRITGTADQPRLDIRATTTDNSLLHVEPLSDRLAVIQEDYIIFANPNDYEPDSLSVLEQRLSAGRRGLDLDLILEVTPKARLNIIIDPMTGDELFCSGSGNFIISMTAAGDLSITGTYIIEEGNYSFNYEGLVKRNFEIRKGSSLSFSGDPYNARFDITAVYKTRATTYELISNEATLGDAALEASRRRSDVEVLLKIAGSINEPEITFDILLPGSQGGLVDNLTARKLSDLRDDPTELNKQVFGLLFFNSFIQSESGTGLAGVGENVALKSVSGLISSQLNRLAGRFVKGVDLTVGFESYRAGGQTDATVTEVQAGLSKQLFNDRLTIKVGANFNLENSQQSDLQQGGQSAIAGDFVLEYKLNERGNYLLKVFHKTDYNLLLDANTSRTGVGVMYRKSF